MFKVNNKDKHAKSNPKPISRISMVGFEQGNGSLIELVCHTHLAYQEYTLSDETIERQF